MTSALETGENASVERVPEAEVWRAMLARSGERQTGEVFRVLVLRTGIAGLGHRLRKYGDFAETLLRMIRPGDRLHLLREPENDADPFAVSVHTGTKLKLGYLPRYKNEPIARLMDVGFHLIAYVDAPPESYIAWSPTEDIRVPIAVYLIL